MAEITLEEMLLVRERRVQRQNTLIAKYHKPLVCFTMNIAGPIKLNALIKRGFIEGQRLLTNVLLMHRIACLYREAIIEHTGAEGYYVVDYDPLQLKLYTVMIEDTTPIGRLFDIDILTDGGKIARKDIGQEERPCLICGKVGSFCARSRTHTVEELKVRTKELLQDYIARRDIEIISSNAVRALLYEVAVTPKPGLVDRNNNGSHTDMDIFTFIDSTSSLIEYFRQCVSIGYNTSYTPDELMGVLRQLGIEAEGNMLSITGGVNTHKGAIFSLGIVCATMARVISKGLKKDVTITDIVGSIFRECTSISSSVMVDLEEIKSTGKQVTTEGERLYVKYGITGARGEVASGLPTVRNVGLKVLKEALDRGYSLNDAGYIALLHIMANTDDTNMIKRYGRELQLDLRASLIQLLNKTPYPSREEVEGLDDVFIKNNISPGGSADILALCYFLYFISKEVAYGYDR